MTIRFSVQIVLNFINGSFEFATVHCKISIMVSILSSLTFYFLMKYLQNLSYTMAVNSKAAKLSSTHFRMQNMQNHDFATILDLRKISLSNFVMQR